MSVKNHPNINAAGFAADIMVAFGKYLRGPANRDKSSRNDALSILTEEITEFVTDISVRLDERFGS